MTQAAAIAEPTVERWIARAVGRYCSAHSRNIYIASFFLPPRKRVAMQAVGGFVYMLEEALTSGVEVAPGAGAVAGAASSACSSGSGIDGRMQMVRERIEGMYGGNACPPSEGGEPEHAVIYVLAGAIARYQIPQAWLIDLAEGMKEGFTRMRWATWGSLWRHFERRGGSVGLILSAIFGVTNSDAQEGAREMGVAVEVTRMLRDLKHDAAANRVMVPLEDLAKFRYSERELLGNVVNENFRALMRFEIERARELYRSAASGICWLGGDGSKLAAATTAVLYCGLLREMERKDYEVFGREIRLSSGQRVRRMGDAWRLARRKVGEREVRGWERR
jgi:phytoene synthase